MAETLATLRRRVELLARMLDEYDRRPVCDLVLYRVVSRGLRDAARDLGIAEQRERERPATRRYVPMWERALDRHHRAASRDA